MFENLCEVEKKYNELTEKLQDPAVIGDREAWKKLSKEHSSLSEIVEKYGEYHPVELLGEALKISKSTRAC